jgi:serine/threonine protein kinase
VSEKEVAYKLYSILPYSFVTNIEHQCDRYRALSPIEWCSLFLGALSYTAPEVFENDQYTKQADIYSFGCVLLDMITCDRLTVRWLHVILWYVAYGCHTLGWRSITTTYLCSTWSQYTTNNISAIRESKIKWLLSAQHEQTMFYSTIDTQDIGILDRAYAYYWS